VGLINGDMDHSLNRFVVYFAYPCMIFDNIVNLDLDAALAREFLIVLVLSLFFFIMYATLAKGFSRLRRYPENIKDVAKLSMILPNNGFIGFPVSLIFMGQKALLLMIAHNTAMSLFVFSYGIFLLRRSSGQKEMASVSSLPKALSLFILNPNILAVILGFLFCWLRIPLPGLFQQYLGQFSAIATPMALVFIGSTLAACGLMEAVKVGVIWECCLGKLVVFPLITLLLCILLPVPTLEKSVICLACCLPTATIVPILAEQERRDSYFAAKTLFLTTLLSAVTIPLFMQVISHVL
jgi:predicted permease